MTLGEIREVFHPRKTCTYPLMFVKSHAYTVT